MAVAAKNASASWQLARLIRRRRALAGRPDDRPATRIL